MKVGDRIKVHIFDVLGREIPTRNRNTVYKVYKHNGQLGIDWNEFTPLDAFATCNGHVIFEEVKA